MKGFIFKKRERAFEVNIASEHDYIYGDSFVVKNDKVVDIGNNVSIEFEHFDFGQDGATKLVLNGRAAITIEMELIR